MPDLAHPASTHVGHDARDVPVFTDPGSHRQVITQQFLAALEGVVERYRYAAGQADVADLCAEVVTAEVAHHLALTRAALRRARPLTQGHR